MPSRYIETVRGETRRIKKDGKRIEQFVENPDFGKPRWGTPLRRLDEAQRDGQGAFVGVFAGDVQDVLADASDDKTLAELRKAVHEKDVTAIVRVRRDDLKNLLNQLTAGVAA